MNTLDIRVTQRQLLDAVTIVARRAGGTGLSPVLAGVLLEADEEAVVLIAFDYDTSARVKIPAAVSEPGRVLVSGRLLEQITKLLPRTDVRLTEHDGQLRIEAGNGKYGLPLLPAEDYPALPELPPMIGEVNGSDWATAARKVAAAGGGKEASPPWITTVLLELGTQLTLAATNRFQVAVIDMPWQPTLGSDDNEPTRIPVPSNTLADVAKNVRVDGPLSLHYDPAQGVLGLHTAALTMTIRLSAVEWPNNWRKRVIPPKQPIAVTMLLTDLESALKRAAALCDKQEPTVVLELTAGELHIDLNTVDTTSGAGHEVLPVEYDGEPVAIHLLVRYVTESLAQIDDDTIVLGLNNQRSPITIRPVGQTIGHHVRLVAPRSLPPGYQQLGRAA